MSHESAGGVDDAAVPAPSPSLAAPATSAGEASLGAALLEASGTELPLQYQEFFSDERPTHELIALALEATEPFERDLATAKLSYRGTREVLEAARGLCASASPDEAVLGALVLSDLGFPARDTFFSEREAILRRLLALSTSAEVAQAAAAALSHMGLVSMLPELLALARHDDPQIRCVAAQGMSDLDSEPALRALADLAHDESADVREIAVHGFSAQALEHPWVRDVLRERVLDDDDDVRAGAIWGLAEARDPWLVSVVASILAGVEVSPTILEAAATLGVPELCAPLRALRERSTMYGTGALPVADQLLDRALAACCAECDTAALAAAPPRGAEPASPGPEEASAPGAAPVHEKPSTGSYGA